MPFRRAFVVALALASGACYRGTMQTGLRPGPDVRRIAWAGSFSVTDASIDSIAARSGCPAGVAKVETAHSIRGALGGLLDSERDHAGTQLLVPCAVAAEVPAEAPREPAPDTAKAGGASARDRAR